MAKGKPAKKPAPVTGRRKADKPKHTPLINDNKGSGNASSSDHWPADGGQWR